MRNDLDVNALDEQMRIIDKCQICRLGLYDSKSKEAYIVPMNFGYEYDNCFIFYFHSSPSGRKHELIKSEAHIGFELDTGFNIKQGDNACSYTAKYESVIGNGQITIVNDDIEKVNALNLIMEHYTGKANWEYNPKYFSYVTIYKLKADKISFRQHK